jgi:hypothetical protein
MISRDVCGARDNGGGVASAFEADEVERGRGKTGPGVKARDSRRGVTVR